MNLKIHKLLPGKWIILNYAIMMKNSGGIIDLNGSIEFDKHHSKQGGIVTYVNNSFWVMSCVHKCGPIFVNMKLDCDKVPSILFDIIVWGAWDKVAISSISMWQRHLVTDLLRDWSMSRAHLIHPPQEGSVVHWYYIICIVDTFNRYLDKTHLGQIHFQRLPGGGGPENYS